MEQLSGEKVQHRPPAGGCDIAGDRGRAAAACSPGQGHDLGRLATLHQLPTCAGGRWNSSGTARNRPEAATSRRNRVCLKVLKTAVSEQQMPRPLLDIFSPLFGFEFFELDAETGRVREFDETFGPVLKQRFFERVYDLAYDGCQVLSLLKQVRARDVPPAAPDPHRRWVYLATTTSDVADERDRIKRELLERGHVVLPDAPLPMLSRDVETMVRDCLAKCTIAIHLLGQRYGVTPEDSSESIPALQVRLTAEPACRPDLQRLIWMPGGGESADERQRAFVLRVQEDPALHHRAEIIEGNLNLLKKDLIRRLAPPEEKPKAAAPAKSPGGAPKLYLICDPKDEAAVEALEDYLFAQGLEVMLPAFDGDDADAAALHQDNLLTCNAVLVYYGAAPKAWVDIKLRELLKATGYGRAGADCRPGGLHRAPRRPAQGAVPIPPGRRDPPAGRVRTVCGTGHLRQPDQGGVRMSRRTCQDEPLSRSATLHPGRGLPVLWPRRTDDGTVAAPGRQPLRGGRGHLGQRQVVAGPLRTVVATAGRQDARGRRLVGDRRHASRRQSAGALDRRAPGGRPLRSRARTRPRKSAGHLEPQSLRPGRSGQAGRPGRGHQLSAGRRPVRGDLSLPRSRPDAAGSRQRVRQPAAGSGGAEGGADLRRADDAFRLHRRVRSVRRPGRDGQSGRVPDSAAESRAIQAGHRRADQGRRRTDRAAAVAAAA